MLLALAIAPPPLFPRCRCDFFNRILIACQSGWLFPSCFTSLQGTHQTLCGPHFRDTRALICFAGYTFATPMLSNALWAILSRHQCSQVLCGLYFRDTHALRCFNSYSQRILWPRESGSLSSLSPAPFRERTKRFVGYTFATPVLSYASPATLSRHLCSQVLCGPYFRDTHAQ